MKVLIIWNEVPEYTRYVTVEPGSEPHLKAQACAGKYIGGDECTPEMEWLNDWMAADDGANLLECNHPISGPFIEVIVCGIMM